MRFCAAGIPVTRRPVPEYTFNGTNPSLADFTAVIHLNGNVCCYGIDMTTAGQSCADRVRQQRRRLHRRTVERI